MNAAQKDYNERANKELVAFMSLETMFPDESVRALANAARKGRIKKIDDIVRSGVDVNSRGRRGATPLFWAMRNYNGFHKLLELGADPNVVFEDGGTIFYWAVVSNRPKILRAMLDYGGNPNTVSGSSLGTTPIFEAIWQGTEMIDILLNAHADINARDKFGSTPMMNAAATGDYDIILYLLEHGADHKLKNNSGEDLLSRLSDDLSRGRFKTGSKQFKQVNKIFEWIKENPREESQTPTKTPQNQ
jgi:ankyrin repeat protein